MSFEDFLHESAGEINKEIELFFHNWIKDVEQISPRLNPYSAALWDACRGGKRIRGSLVMLGYEMANGEGRMANRVKNYNKEILKICIAYEIFQTAILGHDDIIDRSELRRGMKSLYGKMGMDHTGISKAVCLGDIGFFLSFKIITESGFDDRVKNKALKIFSKAMYESGIGELMDVDLADSELIHGREEIIKIYGFKTAYYTITAPLLIGAILGGINEDKIIPLQNFGQNLGIAFQIQDDINDIFSEKQRSGKEPGGDIKEGKYTLLYLFVQERLDKKQKEILKSFYGNPNIGDKEIEKVQVIMKETGALELAEEEAERYARKARDIIPGIIQDKEFQEMLREMTEFFVK